MPKNQYCRSVWRENLYTEGDIVRMVAILAFVALSLMITAYALPNQAGHFYLLIYCIPIILISLWFPRQGVKVTTFLVAGFLLINLYYSMGGVPVDPILSGLYASIFFWMLGATSLFTRNVNLAVSRYRKLIEDAEDARFLCDAGTLRILAVNLRCAEIFGYEPYELVGVPPETLWGDEAERLAFAETMGREGYVGNLEQTFLSKGGEVNEVLLSGRALLPDNIFECSLVNIGQLRSERDLLLKSNGRLQRLIYQSHDLIFMQDTSGRFVHFYWLWAAENGIDPSEMIGKTIDALLPSEAAERYQSRLCEVIETRATICSELTCGINGSTRVLSMTLGPMPGPDGELVGVVGTARDITEMKQQRLACMQLEWEIDQWKEFITTAAHELRTPLQPIVGYLRLMLDDPEYYALNAESCRLLALCLESSSHECAVVDTMLELSPARDGACRTADIGCCRAPAHRKGHCRWGV